MLAKRWAERDTISVRLDPRHLALEPGCRLHLPVSPSLWLVDRCTVESFVPVVRLRPSGRPGPAISADSGRLLKEFDEVAADVEVAVFDIPDR